MSQWVQFKNPSEALQALRELISSNPVLSDRQVLQETKIAMLDRNGSKKACYITAESKDLVKGILSSDPLRDHHVVEELPSGNVPRGVLELYQEATFATSKEYASHAILIDTEQSEQSYKRMLDSISRFPGFQMEYVRLEDVENPEIQLRGVKLIAVGHAQIDLPVSIAGQRILRLCGQNTNVGIPVSKRCLFIEHFDFLLPDLKGNEILLREHENRPWRKWKISTLKLADTITFTPPSTETVSYSTLDADYLHIAPEFVYDGSRRSQEVFSGSLIECIKTERGKGNPRLLELFDFIESSNLQNATYYVKRSLDEGKNPYAPVWHYIQYSVEEKQLPNLYNAIRFVQPTVFARENLPIYLQSGFRFKPDITNLLENLPKDHSLFIQLKSICENAAEEDAVFIIEGRSNNQMPKPRKLVNGRPLLDSLEGIDFLKDELFTINLATERKLLFDAKNTMVSHREEYIDDLMLACDNEEKAISIELTEVLASLDKEVKESCDKCDSLNAQKTYIKKIANKFEQVVKKDSVEIWNELLNVVIKSLDEMAAPRISWLMEESERVLKQEEVLDREAIILRDIVKEIRIKVASLKKSLDQCKDQKKAIDALEEKANAAKKDLEVLDLDGARKMKKVHSDLEEWRNKIIVKEDDVRKQFLILKELDEKLSKRKIKIQREESENTQWRGRLETLSDSIDSRIKQAKAETSRLERLEQVEIPNKTRDKNRLELELTELKEHDYDAEFKTLSSEVKQITFDLTQEKQNRDSAKEMAIHLRNETEELEIAHGDLQLWNSEIPVLKDKEEKLKEAIKVYEDEDVADRYTKKSASLRLLKIKLGELEQKGKKVKKVTSELKDTENITRELGGLISLAEKMNIDNKSERTIAELVGRSLGKFKRLFRKKR